MKRVRETPGSRRARAAGTSRGGGTRDPRPRRPGKRRAWFVALALLAAVVALRGRWGLSRMPADPHAGLSAGAATDSAWALIRAGRYAEAIPFIARFDRLAPDTGADFAWGFAMTYSNATVQLQQQDGLTLPATRSSVERVALLREFLRKLDAGGQRAADRERKRNLLVARAGLLALWGFAREGFADYRRADEILALTPRGAGNARRLEQLFIDPIAESR